MSPREAETYLLSLELFGMRFGLDRMRRLMTVLGHPERKFRSIHVVGTNGKSSTARMTAAILSAHGVNTGAYLSPHLVSFAERIRIGDRDVEPAAFGSAVGRAARAAKRVNRSQADDDPVTQFEALTAAAFSELAEQEVEAAVIEAGLGGRFDATNVIPSAVQVLTGVSLEHTRWLGPTIAHIAAEKLDVVREGGTLVLGAGMPPDALSEAERVAAQRSAKIVYAQEDPGVEVGAAGAFQRRNFAVALAAAGAFLQDRLDPVAVAAAATTVRVPGRMQTISERPLTILDGAHNPDGVAALVDSVAALPRAGGRLVAVVSILEDKDAAGMLHELIKVCDELVFTGSGNPRALPAPTLQSLSGQLHGPASEVVGEPRAALKRAREVAGPEGTVLVTGSIYLIADLLSAPSRRQASTL